MNSEPETNNVFKTKIKQTKTKKKPTCFEATITIGMPDLRVVSSSLVSSTHCLSISETHLRKANLEAWNASGLELSTTHTSTSAFKSQYPDSPPTVRIRVSACAQFHYMQQSVKRQRVNAK